MRIKSALVLLAATVLAGAAFGQSATSQFVGHKAPELAVGSWLNTKAPLSLAKLKGKIIVMDFWAFW